MDFSKFVEWSFYAIISGCSVYGVNVLSKMKEDISLLAITLAKIVTKVDGHEKRLDKHEEKIDNLISK